MTGPDDATPPATTAGEEARLVGAHRTLALAGLVGEQRGAGRQARSIVDVEDGHPAELVDASGWVS